MAGHGPAPKEAGRRRRNEPTRGDWVDLPPIEAPVLPELPRLVNDMDEPLEWRAATVATWAAWRSDPVSAQWSPSDVAYALDTIRLHNFMTSTTASEVRLRMDALGLTPKGKRDLRWRITAEPVAADVAPPVAEVRRLRAVDATAGV